MNAKELTKGILEAVNKPNAPVGILIEAVIEQEFTKYEDLLSEIKKVLSSSYADDYAEINDLVEKIDKVKQYV